MTLQLHTSLHDPTHVSEVMCCRNTETCRPTDVCMHGKAFEFDGIGKAYASQSHRTPGRVPFKKQVKVAVSR